ncbi:heavy metal translocating P-type ATPase [Paenibacillus mucilaginosus 3016]|uniref:Heavy metal translocating P-type ATPase n=2 Tax=Paenibacillus mucilaginosus TaxID=61624 RepID=H6N9B3_9BACL|nr:heavy metal translocating P-type ATPase [Paenibacillus mucilaginosus 3016]
MYLLSSCRATTKMDDLLKSDKNGSKVEFEFTFNGTAMFAAVDGSYAGPVAVIDTLKEKSKESVGRLKELGIEVIMITGDNRRRRKPSWEK